MGICDSVTLNFHVICMRDASPVLLRHPFFAINPKINFESQQAHYTALHFFFPELRREKTFNLALKSFIGEHKPHLNENLGSCMKKGRRAEGKYRKNCYHIEQVVHWQRTCSSFTLEVYLESTTTTSISRAKVTPFATP